MLGTQVGDELRDLGVGERVREGWHLLAAVENLVRYLFRCPKLIGAQAGQIGGLLSARASSAMTVCAAFIAKQKSACLLVCLLVGGEKKMRLMQGQNDKYSAKTFPTKYHDTDFLMMHAPASPPNDCAEQRCGFLGIVKNPA